MKSRIDGILLWSQREPLPAACSETMSLPTVDLQKTETFGGVRCTFEQFLAQADEDVWSEWVEGEVFIMSPASDQHQDLVGFLAALLRLFIESRDAGWVRMAPFAMHLAERAREPDLLFVREERMDRVQSTYLEGPADLVVEILSVESTALDRGGKFVEYEVGGVTEYWLIDPLRKQCEFFRLDARGLYQLMPLEAGVLTSQAVAGFRLRIDWLWRKPLPKILEAAAELGLLG
jgi:Uma2 family endonuclease